VTRKRKPSLSERVAALEAQLPETVEEIVEDIMQPYLVRIDEAEREAKWAAKKVEERLGRTPAPTDVEK